ncbi:MAG TPA: aminotransferase class I/II-fold pyridoxal phosphate-dependent enzyme [Thermoanaerobaculia bacterium]|nr:aminotransferase class I/II-fold pyridoxal phosphate-dependent enzyme [Thermoanaerobaculia bacterium]
MLPKHNQRRAPICEAIQEFRRKKTVSFTSPGHKAGRAVSAEMAAIISRDAYRWDVSMLNGVDDRLESNDVQGQAEDLAAALYGADASYFSTNGSSLSSHVALAALAPPGGEVIVARNTHKSLAAGLIFTGQKPVFVYPEYDEELDLVHGIRAEDLEATLKRHKKAGGVLLVSPDYYGFAGDMKKLARVVHAHGKPLVVDEAWGVLFPFHPDFPQDALNAGADVVFGSFHKVLASIQQSAVIHLKGKRVDGDRLRSAVDLFQTTSASSLLLASIDAARREMALHGKDRWGETIRIAEAAVEQLNAIGGISVVTAETAKQRETVTGFDPTKVVIDVSNLGVTGFEASDWLRDNQNIAMELADYRRILGIISLGDTDATARRLVRGVRALVRWAASRRKRTNTDALPRLRELKSHMAMTPRDAFFADAEMVNIDDAPGRIAAELASPYPPGIPLMLPGEVITEAMVQYLKEGKRLGMLVADVSDQKLKKLRVVRK